MEESLKSRPISLSSFNRGSLLNLAGFVDNLIKSSNTNRGDGFCYLCGLSMKGGICVITHKAKWCFRLWVLCRKFPRNFPRSCLQASLRVIDLLSIYHRKSFSFTFFFLAIHIKLLSFKAQSSEDGTWEGIFGWTLESRWKGRLYVEFRAPFSFSLSNQRAW